MDHSEAVTERYLQAANRMPEGYWDDAHREVEYFENDVSPTPGTLSPKGNCVGEFDVLLVNEEDEVAYYEEIKTSYSDITKAHDQIERAKEFFEDTPWDIYGSVILER